MVQLKENDEQCGLIAAVVAALNKRIAANPTNINLAQALKEIKEEGISLGCFDTQSSDHLQAMRQLKSKPPSAKR